MKTLSSTLFIFLLLCSTGSVFADTQSDLAAAKAAQEQLKQEAKALRKSLQETIAQNEDIMRKNKQLADSEKALTKSLSDMNNTLHRYTKALKELNILPLSLEQLKELELQTEQLKAAAKKAKHATSKEELGNIQTSLEGTEINPIIAENAKLKLQIKNAPSRVTWGTYGIAVGAAVGAAGAYIVLKHFDRLKK